MAAESSKLHFRTVPKIATRPCMDLFADSSWHLAAMLQTLERIGSQTGNAPSFWLTLPSDEEGMYLVGKRIILIKPYIACLSSKRGPSPRPSLRQNLAAGSSSPCQHCHCLDNETQNLRRLRWYASRLTTRSLITSHLRMQAQTQHARMVHEEQSVCCRARTVPTAIHQSMPYCSHCGKCADE